MCQSFAFVSLVLPAPCVSLVCIVIVGMFISFFYWSFMPMLYCLLLSLVSCSWVLRYLQLCSFCFRVWGLHTNVMGFIVVMLFVVLFFLKLFS